LNKRQILPVFRLMLRCTQENISISFQWLCVCVCVRARGGGGWSSGLELVISIIMNNMEMFVCLLFSIQVFSSCSISWSANDRHWLIVNSSSPNCTHHSVSVGISVVYASFCLLSWTPGIGMVFRCKLDGRVQLLWQNTCLFLSLSLILDSKMTVLQ
jgi:hypothetical protein